MDKMKVVLILLVVLVLASVTSLHDSSPASAQAQTSEAPFYYLLKIDEIKGEAIYQGHEEEIDINSYSWGELSGGTPSTGGAGLGRVAMEDFYFSAPLSKASPKLLQSVAAGSKFKEAVFTIVKEMGDLDQAILEVKLEDVSVTSYHTSGIGDRPTESFSLKFGKITYTYYVYGEDHSLLETIVGSWDLRKNTP